MVYDLGLEPGDLAEVNNLYGRSHALRCTVQVTDLEHTYVQDISDAVIDGQVTLNWEGDEATRSLELLVYDPDFEMGFDVPDSSEGVWFFDRMIQVRMEMYAPEQGRWVEFPMFTGPVRGYKRTASLVNLQCIGKDIFVRKSWPSYTLRKGTNKITAIRKILRNAGETRFRFEATTSEVLTEDKVINRTMTVSPWGWARARAADLGLRLFYNGNGEACLRPRTGSVDWVFADGDDGVVLTNPDVSADYARIANIVRTTSSKDPKVYGEARVKATSPISPSVLKRGGQPLYFGHEYLSDAVKTKAEAKRAAQEVLEDRQRAAYTTKLDIMPVWAAEEYDLMQVRIDGDLTKVALLTASFGLSPDAPMTIGYRRMVAPALANIRSI